MSPPVRARALGAHVSLVAGLDGAQASPHPEPDPDAPRADPHDSHAWVLYDRWAECETCGARDHWEVAELPCQGAADTGPVTIGEALVALRADLDAFADWWRAKDLGDLRPTIAEWTAEFVSWVIYKGPRGGLKKARKVKK